MHPRIIAAAEVVLIIGLVLAIIWVVKPLGRPGLDMSLRAAVALLLLGSPWLHRDAPQRLGLRLDNLGAALRRVLPVTLLAAVISIAAGYALVSIEWPGNPIVALAYYFMWAAAQQFALQSVILLRLDDAGLRSAAPLAAALLFSLVHAPNPGLVILTFLGGLLWCSTFRRVPNLFAVAFSHAVLAVVVSSTLPGTVTAGYRIGPAYLGSR